MYRSTGLDSFLILEGPPALLRGENLFPPSLGEITIFEPGI